MKYPTKALLPLVSAAVLLSACSSDTSPMLGREGASNRLDAVQAQISSDASSLTSMRETGRPGNMTVRDGVFLGRDGFRTGRGDPLPRRLEQPDSVTLKLGDPVSISDLVPMLQNITGMRIDIRDLQAGAANSSSEADAEGGADSTGAPDTADAVEDGSAAASAMQIRFRVNHRGSLSSLLDEVARQIGADWEYTGGRIKFVGPQTMSYTIWALPGQLQANASVGGGGANESFGASGSSTVTMEREYNYWQDIEAGLSAIVPGGETRYAINRGTGTITVTGFQAVHERVADFVQSENGRLSRQVAVKVDVLAFTQDDEDRRGANLSLALEQVAKGLDMTLVGAGTPIDGAASLGATILTDSDPLDSISGSSGVVQALARQGRVSLLNSTSVVAMNNQPTPIAIANERGYLAGTTTTTDSEGNETTELRTGIVNNGMNMTVTPRVLSGGEVLVNYTMTLTELLGMETFATDASTVQLPEVETRNFMQTVNMGSGDSLVIASFDSQRTDRNASGPFNPRFWGLGGNDAYSTQNTKIVVIMTPVVLEAPNAPRAGR